MGKKLTRHLKFFLIALLTGLALLSIFKYAILLKEKYDLSSALELTKEQAAALEAEKQNLLELYQQLSRENEQLKGGLRASEEKLAKLGADFASAAKTIEDLNSFISIAEAEITALREENKGLEFELGNASQAKEALEARMSSVTELKKAIRQLKVHMRQVKVGKKKNIDAQKAIQGNRGFLTKDGKFTYPAKVKIEVTPLPQ